MNEYAKIDENGIVRWVIVADAAHIAERDDGPWILTPHKVSVGDRHENGVFTHTPAEDAPSA